MLPVPGEVCGVGAEGGCGGKVERLAVEIGEEEVRRGRQPGLGEGELGDPDGEVGS